MHKTIVDAKNEINAALNRVWSLLSVRLGSGSALVQLRNDVGAIGECLEKYGSDGERRNVTRIFETTAALRDVMAAVGGPGADDAVAALDDAKRAARELHDLLLAARVPNGGTQ